MFGIYMVFFGTQTVRMIFPGGFHFLTPCSMAYE